MPIRMTGMISNLDTDSIVKELMKAQSQKKVKIENKITLNEWTTEKWSALNDKIKSFYTGILSKVKMQGEYQTKKATSSNEEKLTVSAAIGATNGSYTIEVERLATSQSMTSAKIPDRKVQETVTNPDGSTTTTEVEKPVTTSTKLSELGGDWGNNSVINIQNGDKTVEFEVTENTTISDFINTCKSAGLTANFDEDQKRIFLSSSESGEDSKFSITTSSINNTDILNKKKDLREEFGYESASSTTRVEIDSLINKYVSEEWASDAEDAALNKLENLLIQATTTEYVNDLKDKWENDPSSLDGDARTMMDNEASIAETKYRQECLDNDKDIDEEKLEKLRKEAAAKAASEYAKQKKSEFDSGSGKVTGNPYFDKTQRVQDMLFQYKMDVKNMGGSISTDDGETTSNQKLASLGLATVNDGIVSTSAPTDMGFVKAENSQIKYNGATITGSTNDITVNNLTFTLKDVTAGEKINVSVSNNTDGIYDMVKEFVKGYNDLLKSMNEAYNAKSARGYDPLTSEQKEAMTDEEVEKWETKIKDSLLRRDDKLAGIISVMRSAMQGSVTVNGKRYSLASLGIGSPDYTEKGLLHIDGNADDALTAGNKDKLKRALSEDPNAVAKVITTLTSNLYDSLREKMKSSTMSSTMTAYNDKQMEKELKNYKKELEKMEDRLEEIEDKYYKQFTAMEVALSKLNSQSNSFSSIAGFN